MDADLSHSPDFIPAMWKARRSAEVVVASRYIPGGRTEMPILRLLLGKYLNLLFSRILDLRLHDMTSGYRLYARHILDMDSLTSASFNILQEILLLTLLEGYRIVGIPFTHKPDRPVLRLNRLAHFGLEYLKKFLSLWKLRNSISAAEYDARAYHSLVTPRAIGSANVTNTLAACCAARDRCWI